MEEKREAKILGICGPSGSGKTTLARSVGEAFDITLVSTDGYFFLDPPVKKYGDNGKNWELPENIDWGTLKNCLRSLKAGNVTKGQTIHWESNTYEVFVLTPKPVVIIEGLHVLHDSEIVQLLDLGVYIDVPDAVGLERRIEREGHDDNQRWFEEVTFPEYAHRRKLYESRADVILDGSKTVKENAEYLQQTMLERGFIPS